MQILNLVHMGLEESGPTGCKGDGVADGTSSALESVRLPICLKQEKTVVILTPFQPSDFDRLISWIGDKDLLVTIAGTEWTYPLTAEQLQVYLDKPESHAFNLVDDAQNITLGHTELIVYDDGTCKIDKLIIGDPAYRGKGLCPQVMQELLDYAFTQLPIHTVELNVFDWNSGAIRCYEKVGFQVNPAKKQTFEVDEHEWVAFNMSVQKSDWEAGRIQP